MSLCHNTGCTGCATCRGTHLSLAEQERLFHDVQSAARRYGGAASRDLFNLVVEFAAAGDPDARRTLVQIYQIAARELLAQRGERSS